MSERGPPEVAFTPSQSAPAQNGVVNDELDIHLPDVSSRCMARSQRTPFVILGLLALSGRRSRSGYEIKKVIDTVISSFWHESAGQIYPALEQLAASGAIKVQAATRKGRKKTLYAITAEGRAQLRSWLA